MGRQFVGLWASVGNAVGSVGFQSPWMVVPALVLLPGATKPQVLLTIGFLRQRQDLGYRDVTVGLFQCRCNERLIP